MSKKEKAIIIGAGPAGLTAAYELLQKTGIQPIILEKSDQVGGIARTEEYKNNRIDIGGHRFYSKSEIIMDWWQNFFPVHEYNSGLPRNQKFSTETDNVFLIRERVSRIFYDGAFFDYPVSLSLQTLKNLGFIKTIKIISSYIYAKLFPSEEKSLEDFFINRFGSELYETFFKNYTEKVWGKACKDLSPDWGAQRIKKLSITRVILHSLKNIFRKSKELKQEELDTSLISRFLYPKYGPGQFWEVVLEKCLELGAEVRFNHEVNSISLKNGSLIELQARTDKESVEFTDIDYIFSSMPVQELFAGFTDIEITDRIKNIVNNLEYRDFITIGLLLEKLQIKNETDMKTINDLIPDNWIYIQDSSVKVGRLQIFNNWSPFMVSDVNKVWLGMEYFCNQSDDFWQKRDDELVKFAIQELDKINFATKDDVLESTVIRSPKTYPVYNQAYQKMDEVQSYLNQFDNLFLIGRNGMHRYNNMDHSMLTAIKAVENIKDGVKDKSNIWNVNVEKEYLEKSK